MTEDEEIRRGFEAQRILEEPLLKEAFSAIESAILTGMKRIDVGARDAQRDLIVTLQLLDKLRAHIQTHITTGKLADIAKQESLATRARRRIGL
jgi:hypothetical protein